MKNPPNPQSRLDAIRVALARHRQAEGRPVNQSIVGLTHYLEEVRAALDSARPSDAAAVQALQDEILLHEPVLELAGLQLELWRSDFSSRATPDETYAADARLQRQPAGRVLGEG